MPLDMSKPKNEEILRIRGLAPQLYGTIIAQHDYRCPPKDFKVLRAERKARWKALGLTPPASKGV